MVLDEAKALALSLMAKHGLKDWKFAWGDSRRALGKCRFLDKTIELSIHFTQHGALPQIKDTILHEIAHALVGGGHGHDIVWKQKAIEVGATPKACTDHMPESMVNTFPYKGTCTACGATFGQSRLPQGSYAHKGCPKPWVKGHIEFTSTKPHSNVFK